MEIGAEFWPFFAVGAVAQLIDGALGMGYGVISSTALLSLGVPPANVSASVHTAKVFTGAASAISHAAHLNVDGKLLLRLSAGGIFGALLGTYVLTSIDGDKLRLPIVIWLGIMGLAILWRAWKSAPPRMTTWMKPLPLGFAGGFFDSVGGGGWGPVVTSSLLGTGSDPRKAIGTTNAAEFFVALSVSVGFLIAIVSGHWDATGLADQFWSVAGLIAGGAITAPIAGWTTKVLPIRALTWAVGLLVVALTAWQAVSIFLQS
jgi:uncharacterized membrane protein YfcA